MAQVCRVAKEMCCAVGTYRAARVCRIAVQERRAAGMYRAARAALAVQWSGCAARVPPFVYYWLVAERAHHGAARAFLLERKRQSMEQAWYAARAFPLERKRQSMERARRGAARAFLMCQSMEREQGARQELARRLLSRSWRVCEQARAMLRQW
jgi:hypothetical protein